MRQTYGTVPPGTDLSQLPGKLIVVEGADGAGRSTQVDRLIKWLEQQGYPCVETGLQRSTLVAEELSAAKMYKVISPRTLSLFYATDFADRLENSIVPALRSGFVVVADRYIYTLMARDRVRGADSAWLQSLYSIALVPDIVLFLDVSIPNVVERTFLKSSKLKYWESGMDMGLSRDWYESFIQYQGKLAEQFHLMTSEYDFAVVDGNRSPKKTAHDIKKRVAKLLGIKEDV